MSNLNEFQFSMFERAGDLADPSKFSSTEEGISNPGFRAKKLAEAKNGSPVTAWVHQMPLDKRSFYDDIAAQGVHTPVNVALKDQGKGLRKELWDGNHRVIAANDIDPSMEVPVRWVYGGEPKAVPVAGGGFWVEGGKKN